MSVKMAWGLPPGGFGAEFCFRRILSMQSPMNLGTTIFGLLGWLAFCFSAAFIGAFIGPGEWYASLNKPSWTPPGWLFGPVWTLLYIMMAVSAWLVWKQGGFAAQTRALLPFFVQMALNAAWTPLFFGLQQPGLALINILLLMGAITWTMISFRPIHQTAAGLLVPYLAWVTFATALNGTIWWMN
jgi:tryptophan-rich sensory protein